MGMTMDKIKVTINGKEYSTDPGKTILQVIKDYDIDEIPTLCHDERLTNYGSCFLCVVEVEGLNRLLPSCSSLVNDGMKIQTNNEKIKSSRKTALELLLSNHYADCLAPCKETCPAGVDVQGYISLIEKEKYSEAIQLIKNNNPLPLICGRVCVKECEAACRRNEFDDPVSINFLKRYAADIDIEDPWKPEIKVNNNRKVAVIGGGPSGLSCAYYLKREGYSVKIFEKLPHLGGMLRYGIPEYRLPKATLDREINWIIDLGIDVETGINFGKDITTSELLEEYDAVFLSIGAHKPRKFGLVGEDSTDGVLWGVDFLRETELNGPRNLSGTVVVVGGGNTAIDAARTALRSNADVVKLVYRRGEKEMPADPIEIAAAKEEGVEFLFLTNPTRLISQDDKLKSIECIKMKLKEDKNGGRPRPVPIEGSEINIDCDFMISAIGQDVDTVPLKTIEGLDINRWDSIEVNSETLKTSCEKIFAGGDAVTGPLTAINAIAQGKTAAKSIDNFVKNGNSKGKNIQFYSRKSRFGEIGEFEYEDFIKSPRNKMPELEVEERVTNFEEVDLGFSRDQALDEANRCLECGCVELYDCTLRKYSSEYEIDVDKFKGHINRYKIDYRHPLITIDSNKCISCGKCVRTCSEILKVAAIDFVYRGFKSVVKPAMEKALLETNCISCGNCIDVCPTGALSEKMPTKVCGTLFKQDYESICNFCSIGCNLNYKVVTEDYFYVSNSTKEIQKSHNKGFLCSKGRFGYRYLMGKDRLLKPVLNTNGSSKEVEWNEAIEKTIVKIREIIKKYGPDSVAVFGAPKMTNEELYLLQKFTRKGLKTNNIDSFSNLLYGHELDSLDDIFGVTTSTTNMDELAKADTIIAINSGLGEDNLVMELKIKEAQKKGARLILINSSEIKMAKFADLWIDSIKGSNTALINGLVKNVIDEDKLNLASKNGSLKGLREMISEQDPNHVSEVTGVSMDKLDEFFRLAGDPDANIVFVYNIDSHKEKAKNDLKALGNFLRLSGRLDKPGNGLILLRDFSNSAGLLDMGVSTKYLPGYVKTNDKNLIAKIGDQWQTDLSQVFKETDLKKRLHDEEIKAVLIFGEDPLADSENERLFNGVEFMMVADIFPTVTSQRADVILPMASYIEQDGSYTACDLRIQKSEKIFRSKTNKMNWQFIADLASEFADGFDFETSDDIYNEIKEVNRFYENCEPGEFWAKNLYKNGFINDDIYAVFDIDVSTMDPQKPVLLSSEDFFKNRVKV